MVAFVVAGLAGLLGRGPLSHATAGSPGTGLKVDYEPVTRSQASTQVTFNLDNLSQDPTVDIFVGTNIVEPMGLQRFEPPTLQTRLVDGGMVVTITVPPGTRSAKLRLILQPMSLGSNELIAQRAGYAAQRWSQFVLP